MSIGERIRQFRTNQKMTQKQLGERAGIAEPTIRKYESGKLNPKIETLQKIAEALNITVYELNPDYFSGTGFKTNLLNHGYDSNAVIPKHDEPIVRYNTPGYRLKISLQAKHVTLNKLSYETGIAVEELNDFISSERNLPLERIYKICQALELDCGYLLTGIPTTEQDAAAAAALGTPGIIDMEQVENTLRNNLLKAFDNVNYSGKLEAVKRVQELSQLQKYKKEDNNE